MNGVIFHNSDERRKYTILYAARDVAAAEISAQKNGYDFKYIIRESISLLEKLVQ